MRKTTYMLAHVLSQYVHLLLCVMYVTRERSIGCCQRHCFHMPRQGGYLVGSYLFLRLCAALDNALQPLLYLCDVSQCQLKINYVNVLYRIYLACHMDHVLVLKAPDNLQANRQLLFT